MIKLVLDYLSKEIAFYRIENGYSLGNVKHKQF